jgi:peptide/nickel transport system ATP-binding protein
MYVGRLVELASVDRVFAAPRHPYTEALLSAVPVPDPTRRPERILLSGEVADPGNPPPGCAFHPRCRYAEAECRRTVPELREIAPGHFARCHFADTLELAGIAD